MATKAKKKTSVSVKRPAISSKKAAEDQSIKLSKQVEKHKKTIQGLKSQIKEQEALTNSRDELKTEVDSLSQTKSQLEVYISQNSSKEKAFDKIIKAQTSQKNELDKYLEKAGPKKKSIQAELHELEKEKQSNLNEIENYTSESGNIQAKIEGLQQSKEEVEGKIKELESEYALYPKDMKNMSRDAKNQLKSYARLALASITLTLLLTTVMFVFLFGRIQMETPFADQVLILIIASIGVFSFLIYHFLKLSKGFISQYISIRNRLTTLRVTDFLMSRLENEKPSKSKKDERADLANTYISEIMRFENCFDKK